MTMARTGSMVVTITIREGFRLVIASIIKRVELKLLQGLGDYQGGHLPHQGLAGADCWISYGASQLGGRQVQLYRWRSLLNKPGDETGFGGGEYMVKVDATGRNIIRYTPVSTIVTGGGGVWHEGQVSHAGSRQAG